MAEPKNSLAMMNAVKKYNKDHCRQYNLKYNLSTDAAIIEKLDTVSSKQDYIRQLILKDIKESS